MPQKNREIIANAIFNIYGYIMTYLNEILHDIDKISQIKTDFFKNTIAATRKMQDKFTDWKAADRYYDKRQKYNKKISSIINISKIKSMLNPIKFKYSLLLMSSYPNFNLIKDSDVDFGLLVRNLDMEKLFQITILLTSNGFKPNSMTLNKNGMNAYRFIKIINGLEVEIKIRDYKSTIPIQKLHIALNSAPIQEQKYWTYHKYLIKNYVKEHPNKKRLYSEFKKILFHIYFVGITGRFRF